MIKCEECAKEFKTQQGLVGHLRFVHGIKTSKQQSLFPSKRFITDDNLIDALARNTATLRVDIYEAVGQVLYEFWKDKYPEADKEEILSRVNNWVKEKLAE